MAITQPRNRKGEDGQDGKNGSVWHSSIGKPDKKLGIDGDWCLDTVTADVYQKVLGDWVIELNIRGRKGKDGKDGQDGKDGVDGKTVVRSGFLGTSGNKEPLFEKKPVTLTANIWQTVTPDNINNIHDVEIYDDSAAERVELDLKLNPTRTSVELRSRKSRTFTVFFEGVKEISNG